MRADSISAPDTIASGRTRLRVEEHDGRHEDGHRHAAAGEARLVVVRDEPEQVAATELAPQPTQEVQMGDFAYVGPDNWSAGQQLLAVRNVGAQDHQLRLARLRPGSTLNDWMDAEEPGEVATDLAGVARLGAGQTAYLPVDLTAGEYVLYCLVPDPASGQPHVMLGMFRKITVGESGSVPSRASPQRGFVITTPEAYLIPFHNELVYDLAPTGRMVSGYSAEYAFTINGGGEQPRRIERDFTPVTLHPDEWAEWDARARFYDRDGPRSASYGVIISRVKPAYRDIVVAEDGRIWVHRYAEASERTLTQPRRADAPPPLSLRDIPTFDVFEADGQYVGTVIVPNNSSMYVRRGTGLWGTNVVAPGQTHVVRYRIE